MKKVWAGLTILLTISCALGGESVSFTGSVYARKTKHFNKRDHNVRFVLHPGAKGLILKRVKMGKDVALQIRVQNGPHKGAVVWVLYRRGRHDLRFFNHKNQLVANPQKAHHTEALKPVPAQREAPAPDAAIANGTEAAPLALPDQFDDLKQKLSHLGQVEAKCDQSQNDLQDDSEEARVPAPGPGKKSKVEKTAPCADETEPGAVTTDYHTDQANQDLLGRTQNIDLQDPLLVQQAKDILSGLASGASDRDKARAIHDWIVTNVGYNQTAIQDLNDGTYWNKASQDKGTYYGSSASFLIRNKNRGICWGYSNLFAALARLSGLQTKVIVGNVCYQDPLNLAHHQWMNHAWNQVLIDGEWVNVDTTWDTTFKDKFFAPTKADFNFDHRLPDGSKLQ